MTNKRSYGRIDDNKLIEALADGKTKTEAGIIAGSLAKRQNIPDVVKRKSEKVEFKEKLEEHVGLIQSYITEDKIASEDVKSLVWMLDKLSKIMIMASGGSLEVNTLPRPILDIRPVVLPSKIIEKYDIDLTSIDCDNSEEVLVYLRKKLGLT